MMDVFILRPGVHPVSFHIEQEARSFALRHGVTLWLDREGHYSNVVDGMIRRHRAGELAVPVVAFRGSYLELMLALDGLGDGPANDALLVHLPGHTEEAVAATPMLELWEAGKRFRKALDTLVRETATGRVAPTEIEEFLARKPLTLAAADVWLAARLSDRADGLAAALEHLSPEQVARELLVKDTMLAGQVSGPDDVGILAGFLERQFGMDAAWRRFMGDGEDNLTALAGALAGWVLCVEYVHDLRRQPHLAALVPLVRLARPLLDRCRALVESLRTEHPDRYVVLADAVEPHLRDELPHIHADDLGRIDTFRIEEARVLEAAVADLAAGRWRAAAEKVMARDAGGSFWLLRDQVRRWAWLLTGRAAAFGTLMEAHPRPLAGAAGHEDALARYAEAGAAVDREHRRFETARHMYLEPRLPHFAELRTVVETLRGLYRRWADDGARDFTAVCRDHGFVPVAGLQQRTLFEEVVQPLAIGSDRVAVIAVDALRYEMAAELAEEVKGPGVTIDLMARLAELPTTTAVGMNVLAPVAAGGRLVAAMGPKGVTGFRAGEFTVRTIADRARAMGERFAGKPALVLGLADVCDAAPDKLKRQVAQARLILVHSREIDDAGEADLGLATFETTLRQIRAAIVHLLAVGVRHLVVTADHGFLLLDPTVRVEPCGGRREPSRRHAFSTEPRADGGTVAIALSALGWQDGDAAGPFLLVREDTALFDTGVSGATFAHGGNSPPERIIPVMTITRRTAAPAPRTGHMVVAQRLEPVLGHARVQLAIHVATGENESLGFVGPSHIALSLRVAQRDDVRVVLKEAVGGVLTGSRVRLVPGGAPVEVLFALEGPRDERVRVEAFHPDGTEAVAPLVIDGWFDAMGVAGSPERPVGAPVGDDWAMAIADEAVRKVFLHIARHGGVTEEEVGRLLGSPRAARRFAADLDALAPHLPFIVRVETTPQGKRYLKDRET